jgi:hypothetical protein
MCVKKNDTDECIGVSKEKLGIALLKAGIWKSREPTGGSVRGRRPYVCGKRMLY